MNSARELWRLLRPRHWVKNGFVFVGVIFANAWRQPSLVWRVSLAAAAFCLVASGVYIFNDLFDREEDQRHFSKKNRPLAAGRVSPGNAVILLIVLWIVGFGLALLASRTVLAIVLLYILLNIAYTLRLKDVVLLDVFIIASGFMLRILAGTVGVGIRPSQWLLLCGLMLALFLGFTKRRAEMYAATGNGDGVPRNVLKHYQSVLLDKMIVITATGVIITYSLYTMSPVTVQTHHTEALIYTVPFVIYGIFRYLYSLHMHATGSDPSQEIFRDPHILVAILGWLGITLWLLW